MKPLISVVIPTYQRRDKLKVTLDSVLSQTYENYEVLIMDDGSTDGTKEMVNSYSDPIKIDNNYLILKINDIKEITVKIDKEKELDKMIMIETSKQLDKFSNIFYNKIKLNSTISEF